MLDENSVWKTTIAPDGRELVTIGTPDFPAQLWGTWAGLSGRKCTQVPWHWHNELELNLVTRDRELVTADGKRFCLETGQGIFVNRGVLHGSETAPGCDGIYHDSLVFDSSIVGGAPGSVFWQKYLGPVLNAPECRCVALRGDTDWERQALAELRRISAVWKEHRPGFEFEVRTSLSRILLLLKEHCVQHAQAPSEQELRDAERIKQMVDFIRFHQAEPLTTAQIAASAAISVSECLRCFRRVMDRTPKEYLRQHRIRHAVSLLEQTDQSIARIGAACGFDDMSYFARIFRAERGCTPSEYREKLRK